MPSFVTKKGTVLSVTAYTGDAKTLLAFNLAKKSAKNLAGFTIECKPGDQPSYYLHNTLQFKTPGNHAQDPSEPANSSINAPLHKFRWLHVPGSVHQGVRPFLGRYKYTVTPRYFDGQRALQPLDPSLGVSVSTDVVPFKKKGLELGFTRGFTQSQAFVNHFGLKARIRPNDDLLFDTSEVSGKDAAGNEYTYADEYEWLGFTARERIFAVLEEVASEKSLRVDVFAYDLNEPDLVTLLVKLAKQKKLRIILDDAALHHSKKDPKPEDEVETLIDKARKNVIKRGHFGRYAHDKVFIVSNDDGPQKVLTGSTNYSVTGLYVNSNHILVFNDPVVAAKYAEVFDNAWDNDVKKPAFVSSTLSSETFTFTSKQTPRTDITFAPHAEKFATEILDSLVARIDEEGKTKGGSVLFAVMAIDSGSGPVYDALKSIHKDEEVFSYGISDEPGGIALYKPGARTGVLVTGKPAKTQLPPPFNQVRNLGLGHQIHHKFVVCGFNGDDPVVYCGSSNLALGGETANGDNLLAIHDSDVATVFMIEALALVDHFHFLNKVATEGDSSAAKTPSKPQAALSAGWFLGTTDKWTEPYFDTDDVHSVDRALFGM